MFKIIIEKECGCFKRSDMINGETIENKDDALLKSIDMVNTMNNEFCGKHEFKLQEIGADFVIAMNVPASNSCCGGGCS